LKWALSWTGNLSFPRTFLDQGILFDGGYQGWGVEDLDWAYRMQKAGAEIVFYKDIVGEHLPHVRDVTANRSQERKNFYRFLEKAQDPCVELVARFGDLQANRLYDQYYDPKLAAYCICSSEVDSKNLAVGIPKQEVQLSLSERILDLSGIVLPFPDSHFDEVTRWETQLPPALNKLIEEECRRVKK